MLYLGPLQIDADYERRPRATLVWVVVWLLAYGASQRWGTGALLLDPEAFRPWQLLTAAFLHDNNKTLFSSCITLWVFGRYVEDRLGALQQALLLLLFGAVAGLVYVLQDGTEAIPTGVLAATGFLGLALFTVPRASIRVLYIWAPLRRMALPVWLWVGLQLVLLLLLPVLVATQGGPPP